MYNLHVHELTIIQAIQSIRTVFFDNLFYALNIFDHDITYLIIIILVWYLISQRAGFHLLYLQIINIVLCLMLKNFFAQPRPYEIMPPLKIIGTHGYGFPSGAASGIVVSFGFIFFLLKPTHFFSKLCAIVMMLLVGLTRIYVGAHFPSDVLAGYLLGIILLSSYALLHKPIEQFLHAYTPFHQLIFHASFIACLILLYPSLQVMGVLFLLLGAIVWQLFCDPFYKNLLSVYRSKKLAYGSSVVALVGIIFLYHMVTMLTQYISDPICLSIMIFLIACIMGVWLGASAYVLPFLIK